MPLCLPLLILLMQVEGQDEFDATSNCTLFAPKLFPELNPGEDRIFEQLTYTTCLNGTTEEKSKPHTQCGSFSFFCHISLFHSLQTQLHDRQDHLAGVEQHGEFFCFYRKINIWTFVTLSFGKLKNWHNPDQTIKNIRRLKKTDTILTRRPLSTLERSVRVAEAELVDETEVSPCCFAIGQTIVCSIGMDCA